ncbi:copper resistance protein NlpE N-terminal domain-containing protein [Ulvibacterium sp.]|uniref:copper resistance protein NlpE N-terminal domain-containing protein n=1 Tax=Ulvibacterium sp. TaxID=2665914 RepID=UPI002616F538|nr:copper resistance protein NlpE N-terminal domain-containing protein [Ulvibacterium sp.]
MREKKKEKERVDMKEEISKEVEDTNPSLDMGHNSKSTLDWQGTYQGTIPCADCEGIKTSITLFESGKYTRTLTYLGKQDRGITDNGDFTWNDTGAIVTLTANNGSEQAYQVGEDVLFHLDRQGHRISGNLAENYQLLKNATDLDLEDKKWVLIELMGEAVTFAEGSKEATITFHSQLARVTGNNGCNVFTAAYELKPHDRIALGHIAATLMACQNMELATTFNEVLEKVDNYTLADGVLSLNKARMAPMARFQLVETE